MCAAPLRRERGTTLKVAQARVASDFNGLAVTAYVSLGILGIGLLTHDIVRRVKRDTIYWRSGGTVRPLSSEDLGFGYLYHDRQFVAANQSPPLPRWPLQWMVQVFWLNEAWYREHTGLDSVVYVRFLRGCFFFVLLHVLTTFPALFTINVVNSPSDLSADSLARASLSSLIVTPTGDSLLWLPLLFLYWLSLTWMAAILWVGIGALRHRRAHLAQVLRDRPADAAADPRAGWRFRTVVVANVPSDLGLRSERGLAEYFEQGLRYSPAEQAEEEDPTIEVPLDKLASEKSTKDGAPSGLITDVVLVRRTAELQAQMKRRAEALHQLEAAHIQLARNVLDAVAEHLVRRKAGQAGEFMDDVKLDMLTQALEPFLDRNVVERDTSVWQALESLPSRDLLDPYQPLHKLRKRFQGQKVPAVDYWAVKFSVLDDAVRELRSRPEQIQPASTAFVTFRLASDARRACHHLPTHHTRLFAVKAHMAPDARDVIHEKLVLVSFRSDLVRSLATHTLIWFVTLIWVLPITIIVGLVSLDNIAQLVPSLAAYLTRHPNLKNLSSTLLPTLLTSLIAFFVPTMLNQITMRAQHLFTVSKLFDRIGFRYHVWCQANVIVFFCAGTTAIQAVFTDPAAAFAPATVLKQVAAAFPAAAPFYVGWLLLQFGLQNGFEIMLLGYAMIGARATAKAGSPRKRLECSWPRMQIAYWWRSQHQLALAIFITFSLLNSLVIAFALPYFALNLLIIKNQFAHVWYRRHFEGNGRLYTRFMRFSLDSVMLTCVVFIAFEFINSNGGYGAGAIVLLVVTAAYKLALTRWYKAIMAALDVTEADIYSCAPIHGAQDVVTVCLLPAFLKRLPYFRRCALKVPAILLAPAAHLGEQGEKSVAAPTPEVGELARVEEPRSPSRGSGTTETAPILAQAAPPSFGGGGEQQQAASEPPAAMQDAADAMQLMVQRHPPLVRDDRPDYSAPYDDPYLTRPLEDHLWLPRDPWSPLDLNDTVEYRGPALVSSAGGDGRLFQTGTDALVKPIATEVGEILASERAEERKATLYPAAQGPATALSPASADVRRLSVHSASGRPVTGDERVVTAQDVGSRAETSPSWALGLRPPSLSSPRPRASSDLSPGSTSAVAENSYFPPPRRAASSGVIQRLSSHASASPRPASGAPPLQPVIAQADALREEVLAEEREELAARRKDDKALRADEAKEERKAASRDSRRFFSRSTSGSGSGGERRRMTSHSLLRRVANATDP